MRLGSRNRRQGDRRNRQMFLKRREAAQGSSLSFRRRIRQSILIVNANHSLM